MSTWIFSLAILVFNLPIFEEDVPNSEIRDSYASAIKKLESINSLPIHFTFEEFSERTGIQKEQEGKIIPKTHSKTEVFIKGDKRRVETSDISNQTYPPSRVTVVTTPENFILTRDTKTGSYSVYTLGGESKLFEIGAKGGTIFLEAAHRLALLDVKDVLLGTDFEYSITSDRPKSDPNRKLTCKFRRKPISEVPGARKKLLITSGEFVLSVARDWAAESFDYVTNTNAHYVGTIEYQEVKELDLKFVPKRVAFETSYTDKPNRSANDFVGTLIEPGEVSDKRFTLDDFGLGSLNKPASSGIPSAYLVAGLGALLLIAAIVLRIRGAKSKN